MILDVSNGSTINGNTNGVLASMGIIMGVVGIVYLILLVAQWKLYKKAGKPGWASLIPIYNLLVLMDIAKIPRWKLVLLFIPLVQIYIAFKIYIELAHQFGKSTGYGVAMTLLPVIFIPMLAFGSATYLGEVVDAPIMNYSFQNYSATQGMQSMNNQAQPMMNPQPQGMQGMNGQMQPMMNQQTQGMQGMNGQMQPIMNQQVQGMQGMNGQMQPMMNQQAQGMQGMNGQMQPMMNQQAQGMQGMNGQMQPMMNQQAQGMQGMNNPMQPMMNQQPQGMQGMNNQMQPMMNPQAQGMQGMNNQVQPMMNQQMGYGQPVLPGKKICPTCGNQVAQEATTCFLCGHKFSPLG